MTQTRVRPEDVIYLSPINFDDRAKIAGEAIMAKTVINFTASERYTARHLKTRGQS